MGGNLGPNVLKSATIDLVLPVQSRRGHEAIMTISSCFNASRAPSAIALNLAQAISGSTW